MEYVENVKVRATECCCRPQGVTPPPELADDSADLIAQAQYHYNPVRDVVSRGEFIPEAHFKVGLEGAGSGV